MRQWQDDYRRDVDEVTKEVGWTLKKFVTRVFIPVIIVVIIITSILWVVGIFQQPFKVIEKTMDADNIIYNYEWFKQKANSLDAAEKRIGITEQFLKDFQESAGPRKDWTFEDKGENSRLTTDLRGQKAHFEQLKADYRAASLMVNRSIFKGDDKVIRWADQVAEVK